MNTTIHATQIEAANALYQLQGFIGLAQRHVLRDLCRDKNEEHQHFRDMLVTLAEHIHAMPKTYEQDGLGDQAQVHLHYFTGGCDWYITEKDSDPDGTGQVQAFGYANLGDPQNAELGYISIQELIEHNVELDLYWTMKPLAAVKV
jgi:hypothetical protein